jgi:hypothetical protein
MFLGEKFAQIVRLTLWELFAAALAAVTGNTKETIMNGIPSDMRSADHFFGKWGLKPMGRWATPEEAAADPRLLTRPPTMPEDLPQHFSTGRKKYEMEFGLADIGMEAHLTVCWQTPGNQDVPYCPIVSRIIA